MINQAIITTPDRCEYLTPSGVRLIFTSMNPVSRGSGLEAWVMAKWQLNIPDPKPLAFGTYNLKGARTVSTLTSEICSSGGTKLDKDDTRDAIAEAVLDVINVFFEQHDATALDDVEPTSTRWLVRPLLEQGAVTRLVAQGGSLKSAWGLALAVTVTADTPKLLGMRPVGGGGPTLILDWETDASTTAERLRAICRAAGIQVPEGIHYMRMSGSLYLSQRRILAAVSELKPVLLIVDSNAMARGSTGEGGAEESTIRMITALRSFGCASLVIDHKSDEKIRRGISGGYGSIYNRNLARLEWEIVRTARNHNETSIVMRLEKANNIATKRELGFQFIIETNDDDQWHRVEVRPIDPATVAVLASTANTNAEKIRYWLSTQVEAQLVATIALATKLPVATVRTTLARGAFTMFENTTPESAKGHWRCIGQETDEGVADHLPDAF